MELAALYALVPAAEEEDLRDELLRERAAGAPQAPVEEPEQEPPAEPPFGLAQVLGMLEHHLGAQVLRVDVP